MKIKRLIYVMLVMLISFSSVAFYPNKQARAQNGNLSQISTGISYRWEATTGNVNGMAAGWGTLHAFTVDGQRALCIDPTIEASLGPGYQASPLPNNTLQTRIARLAIANNYANMSNEEISIFNAYVWKILHPNLAYASLDVANFQQRIQHWEAINTNYWLKPTYALGDGSIKANETRSFNVNNQATNHAWKVVSASPNVSASIQSQNTLHVQNNNTTDDTITITLEKDIGNYKGGATMFTKTGAQTLASYKLSQSDTMQITLKNIRYGALEITKVDERGTPVAGVSFDLATDMQMQHKLGTYTTGEQGSVRIENLLPQTLYLQEVAVVAPLVVDPKVVPIYIQPNKTYTYTMSNKRAKGTINLHKQDATNGFTPQGDASLYPATYEVFAHEDVIDPVSKQVLLPKDTSIGQQSTSKENLTLSWQGLELGAYRIEEIKAPTGYAKDKDKIIKLTYENQTTDVVTRNVTSYEQVYQGQLAIIKVWGPSSGLQLNEQGAIFTIQLASEVERVGKENATIYDTLCTNEKGYAKSKPLPYGTYIITNTKTGNLNLHKAPDMTFTVKEENQELQTYVVRNNQFEAYAKLIKVDADTNQKVTYSAASFKVKDADGKYVSQRVGNNVYDTFTTTEDGHIASKVTGEAFTPLKLRAGTYTVEEIKTPEGMLVLDYTPTLIISSDSEHLESDEDGNSVISLVIKNKQPTATIQLQKTWEMPLASHTYSAGFELQVLDDILSPIDGSMLYKKGDIIVNKDSEDGYFYTDENHLLQITNLPISVVGKTRYALLEKVTSTGYLLHEEPLIYTFSQTDDKTAIYTENKKLENTYIRTNLVIEKIDAYTNEIITDLDGFEFSLSYTWHDKEYHQVSSIEPSTGKITFTDLPYGATVHVTESKSNDLYLLSDEVYTFVLDEAFVDLGSTHTVAYANVPKPKLSTIAFNKNEEKVIDPTIDQVLIDTLMYENIDINQTYVLVTKLINKESTSCIQSITSEDIRFETHDGIYEVEHHVPANTFNDADEIVFYEYLYRKDDYLERTEPEPYVAHEDINSEDQSIAFHSTEHTIYVEKRDTHSKEPIKGDKNKEVIFEANFYKDDTCVQTKEIASESETGVATLSFVGSGSYDRIEIKEIKAPMGYQISDEIITVQMDDFDDEHVYTIHYFNSLIESMTLPATNDTSQIHFFITLICTSFGGVCILRYRKHRETS